MDQNLKNFFFLGQKAQLWRLLLKKLHTSWLSASHVPFPLASLRWRHIANSYKNHHLFITLMALFFTFIYIFPVFSSNSGDINRSISFPIILYCPPTLLAFKIPFFKSRFMVLSLTLSKFLASWVV